MWVATVKAFINQSIADDVESKKEGKSTNVDRENRALVALRNLDDRDVPPLHTQLLVADLAYNRHVLGHPPGKLAQRHAIVVPSTAKSAILPKQALALRRHDQQLCLVESNAKDGVAYVRDAKQLSVRQVLQTDQTEFDETTIQFDELKTDYFVFVQVPWSAPRCVIFITAQFTNRWCVPLTVMTGLPPSGPAPASSEHSWLYGDDSPWETDLKQASLVPFASITLKKPGLPECAFYSRFFHVCFSFFVFLYFLLTGFLLIKKQNRKSTRKRKP